jgi:hypothetical protein
MQLLLSKPARNYVGSVVLYRISEDTEPGHHFAVWYKDDQGHHFFGEYTFLYSEAVYYFDNRN